MSTGDELPCLLPARGADGGAAVATARGRVGAPRGCLRGGAVGERGNDVRTPDRFFFFHDCGLRGRYALLEADRAQDTGPGGQSREQRAAVCGNHDAHGISMT